MSPIQEDILLLESLLNVKLPESYKDYLKAHPTDEDTGSRVLGFPLSLDLDSAWGATEFVRAARPDLAPCFLAINVSGSSAFCLDLEKGDEKAAPVVQIDLDGSEPPAKKSESFIDYLAEQDPLPAIDAADANEEYGFQYGLQRLDRHMKNLSFQYDHEKGGQIPRSHVWRPYRFCVQDVILGMMVIRHDRKYNRLEADVFLTAQIPEYEADSGCRALALILLSEAYKCGGSMEIRFTEHVEGGRVPQELFDLAEKVGVKLRYLNEGGITPKESKKLYLALSGFRSDITDKIMEMEEKGKISAASVCYALHHGVWTVEELEVILFSSRFPDTILRGSFSAEVWHLFYHDLFHARNALMGGYLDRQLKRREHLLKEEVNRVVELEDDEPNLKISFNSQYCAKQYSLFAGEEPVPIPWLYNAFQNDSLAPDQPLWVLLRARDAEDLKQKLAADIDQAFVLKNRVGSETSRLCIMVPADFKRIDMTDLARKAAEKDIGLIVCPEFLNQLDQEAGSKFETVKVMRQ